MKTTYSFRMALSATALCLASLAAVSPARAQEGAAPAKTEAPPVFCVVRGDLIKDVAKAAGKETIGGKTYYICCQGCVGKMSETDDAGKARFAKVTDLRTEKAVLQKKLDAVNAELTSLETAKAEAKPAASATTAVASSNVVYCAVTNEEIGTADKAAAKLEHNGKTYFVCCAGCEPAFKKDPAKHAAQADKKAAERAAAPK